MILSLQIVNGQEATPEATQTIETALIPDSPVITTDVLTWSDIYVVIFVPILAFFVMWIEKRADKHMVTPEAIALITDNFVKSFNKLGKYVETTDTPIDNVAYDLAKIPIEMLDTEIKRRKNLEIGTD